VRGDGGAQDFVQPGAGLPLVMGQGQLVGWSWHFPPHMWHLGAEATTTVRAYEFDARAVRALCAQDPAFGRAVAVWVGQVVADRLHASRIRLLDLYAPYGSGSET
jgi:CRP-like cAMP-binding protein